MGRSKIMKNYNNVTNPALKKKKKKKKNSRLERKIDLIQWKKRIKQIIING